MLQFAHIALNFVVDHWPALMMLVGGGTGLSVFLQYVLHKFKIDSKKLAYSLIHLLTLGGALAGYYLENLDVLPTYAGLVIAAQTVHRFIISPIYATKILPYLNFLSEKTVPAATAQLQRPLPQQPIQAAQPAPAAPAASFLN